MGNPACDYGVTAYSMALLRGHVVQHCNAMASACGAAANDVAAYGLEFNGMASLHEPAVRNAPHTCGARTSCVLAVQKRFAQIVAQMIAVKSWKC